MKALFVCFILLLGFSSFSQAKKVKIKLIQYFPYCGGARPKQEANNTPNKSLVYANKKSNVIRENCFNLIFLNYLKKRKR